MPRRRRSIDASLPAADKKREAGWNPPLTRNHSEGGPGLRGVRLVISNAHEGLKNAIAAVLDGAIWQRCRTHFMRNLLSRGAPIRQAVVATLVRSTFAQPDAAST